MPLPAAEPSPRFAPASFETFRFLGRSLGEDGAVSLRYGLDDRFTFEERFALPRPLSPPENPVDAPADAPPDPAAVERLLDLLHWTAGVSYYKLAAPSAVSCETGDPSPAAARLLEALYSEGLGEFAVVNQLGRVPHPTFPGGGGGEPPPRDDRPDGQRATEGPRRVLVPVGGGKDSAVAIEIVRRSGVPFALFSVGDAAPIARTAQAAEAPRLIATRSLDPQLAALNRSGALNGHVPITAIISLVAALTAVLGGFDAVALANERSASAPNTTLEGVEINHQFSKSRRAERLLGDAVAETGAPVEVFSILRPASELAIARRFAALPRYHDAFTSCNRIFRLDPARRASSWCGDCDKCRFVFLILAPFLEPATLTRIFGRSMLADETQFEGFALLTGTGGHKPFECVGEIAEAVAAIRLLAASPRWRDETVMRRLAAEVLPRFGEDEGRPEQLLALSDEHSIPGSLVGAARALLGA